MKNKATFLILILFAITICVNAQLAGKKFELKMEQMGTFKLEFTETTYKLINPMGETGVIGNYKIEKNTILFIDKEGQMACQEEIEGKYKFTFENKVLKLELIEDSCTGRPNMAVEPWILLDE